LDDTTRDEAAREFWGEDLASSGEVEAADPVTTEAADPTLVYPQVSGLPRRLGAFIVDMAILSGLAAVVGWAFAPIWVSAGPFGRLFGLVVILVYFGSMDSRIARGQTLGKRVAKVAVRDADNEPISTGRALGRTAIWALPVMLSGWVLPGLATNPVVAWVHGVIVAGVGSALVFTMLFNRRSRQGLHDMLCGTWVGRLNGPRIESFPRASRLQWNVSMALVGVTAIAAAVMPPLVAATLPGGDDIQGVYGGLSSDPRFWSASVSSVGEIGKSTDTGRTLNVQAWYRGAPDRASQLKALHDVGRATLDRLPDPANYAWFNIGITSGYDLLLVSVYRTANMSYDLNGLQSELASPTTPP
jgi:uncharacterized RDD family membrane protein YckC